MDGGEDWSNPGLLLTGVNRVPPKSSLRLQNRNMLNTSLSRLMQEKPELLKSFERSITELKTKHGRLVSRAYQIVSPG